MAIIRRTMENIRRMKPRINRAKIAATSEANIRRHMIASHFYAWSGRTGNDRQLDALYSNIFLAERDLSLSG